MLFGLRHRAIGGRYHEDSTVHLGGTGDHVLDKVSVTGAVDVSIVTLVRLILNVSDCDRNRFGLVTDRTTLGDIRVRLCLSQSLGSLDSKMAPVVVVFPWSMWPIVPTLTWGFVRSKTALAMFANLYLHLQPTGLAQPQGDPPHDRQELSAGELGRQ